MFLPEFLKIKQQIIYLRCRPVTRRKRLDWQQFLRKSDSIQTFSFYSITRAVKKSESAPRKSSKATDRIIEESLLSLIIVFIMCTCLITTPKKTIKAKSIIRKPIFIKVCIWLICIKLTKLFIAFSN